jgi:hypothetical protein
MYASSSLSSTSTAGTVGLFAVAVPLDSLIPLVVSLEWHPERFCRTVQTQWRNTNFKVKTWKTVLYLNISTLFIDFNASYHIEACALGNCSPASGAKHLRLLWIRCIVELFNDPISPTESTHCQITWEGGQEVSWEGYGGNSRIQFPCTVIYENKINPTGKTVANRFLAGVGWFPFTCSHRPFGLPTVMSSGYQGLFPPVVKP